MFYSRAISTLKDNSITTYQIYINKVKRIYMDDFKLRKWHILLIAASIPWFIFSIFLLFSGEESIYLGFMNLAFSCGALLYPRESRSYCQSVLDGKPDNIRGRLINQIGSCYVIALVVCMGFSFIFRDDKTIFVIFLLSGALLCRELAMPKKWIQTKGDSK